MPSLFANHALKLTTVGALCLSTCAYAQETAKGLPSSEPIGLPPAPTEIKLPAAPEAVNLPSAPEELKPLPSSEPAGLPPPPERTNKFPGNQVIVIGEDDPRIKVDQNEMPWRAIGRLRANGGSCTAALIGPSLLLTAAHCVFDARSRQYFQAKNLHFQLGYSEGDFTAEARGTRLIVPDDYDPVLNIGTMSKDWAILELDTEIGTPDRILTLQRTTPVAGDIAALGGYANDNIENLLADPDCRVLGLMFDSSGAPLIRHNCAATQGVSGAPFLIRNDADWSVGGILVVGTSSGIGGAAVLHEVLKAVADLTDGSAIE